jgi:hypothetical protein
MLAMRPRTASTSSIAMIIRQTHGWLELGCPEDAARELENLPDTLHSTREVLKLKCTILAALRQWEELAALAATCADYFPTEPAFGEEQAWAEHQLGRSADAYHLLIKRSKGCQASWRTAYYLACFSYRTNRVREATEWLGLALLLHRAPAQLKTRALREEAFQVQTISDARYMSPLGTPP